MKVIDEKFIAYRAEQLAIVHLTRRDDLRLKRPDTDHGLDIVVSILRKGKDTGRYIGVQARGVMSKDKLRATDKGVGLAIPARDRSAALKLPFPVLLLAFTMDNDEAFTAWLKAPNAIATVTAGPIDLSPLTSEALDHVVDQVNAWYESRSVNVAA